MHVKGWILILGMTVSWPAVLVAQDASDSSAIRQTALDYIEGWYEGDAERMERSVHPRLAKRIVRHRTGEVVETTASALVESTGRGTGHALRRRGGGRR